MIHFEYYKIFYFAGKYKIFTKAARILHTSQPAVSHAMQNLEHELSCRLFSRSNRGIELTPEGELLYSYVAAGCEQFFRGESALLESMELKKGTVYIATTETALHCYLFEVLKAFHSAHPEVRFKLLNLTSSDEAISTLKNGTTDFAIVPSPIYIRKPLRQTDLLTFQDILIAGEQSVPAADLPLSLCEIPDYPFICLADGTATRTFFNDIFGSLGINISPDIEPATTDMILPLVKSNLGIGFVPDPIARETITRGEIRRIPVKEPIPERTIVLVSNAEHSPSFAAKAFFYFLTTERQD